jgi:cytochrome c551
MDNLDNEGGSDMKATAIDRIHSHLIKIIGTIMLLAIAAGCGGGSETDALQDAPPEVASLYKAECLSCHGSDLQGRVGPNTNLEKVGSRMSVSEIVTQIEQGESVMQGFADQLTKEEIQSLADWLSGKK